MLSGAWLIKSPEVRFFPVPLRQLIELVENVVLIRTGRRRSPIHVTAIGSVIMADIILISAVLYFSGGTISSLAILSGGSCGDGRCAGGCVDVVCGRREHCLLWAAVFSAR